MGATIKHRFVTVLLAGITLGATTLIYMDTSSSRQTCELPVLAKDIAIGQRVQKDDLTSVEVGRYHLDQVGLVLSPEELLGKYATVPLHKGRPLQRGEVQSIKPPTAIKEQILHGALTVATDFEKFVGGVPQPGDRVKIKVILKEAGTTEVLDQPQLQSVLVIAVQDKSGQPFKGKRGGMGSEPAFVTFDVDTVQQNALLQGTYRGHLHLVLLPQISAERR